MQLQREFEMARTTIIDVKPLPARRRYRAYLEMLGKTKKEEKERKEDAE
jgi:hypothetical protein